jgi:hypothetical protein
MNTNLNFDDNEIRRNIIEENQMKEKQMEEIKTKLDDIQTWFDIESRVIAEKRKIIKDFERELFIQRKTKLIKIRESYNSKIIKEVCNKYKIPLF